MDIILSLFKESILKAEPRIRRNKNSISSRAPKKCDKRSSAAEDCEKNADDEKKVDQSMRFPVQGSKEWSKDKSEYRKTRARDAAGAAGGAVGNRPQNDLTTVYVENAYFHNHHFI